MTQDCSKNKVVLVGDYGVGKTSLFMRFKSDHCPEDVPSQTRKEADHMKAWTYKGEDLCITLYDTAGMERFEATVPPTYFRNAKAVIFVYSINDQESMNNIIHWTESVAPQRLGDMSQKLIRALVANKIDLPEEERVVTKKRGSDTAENCDIGKEMFFEVSAKTGEGVNEMFAAVAQMIKQPRGSRATATASFPQPQEKKCCSS